MIASLLAFVALAAVAVYVLMLASGRASVLPQRFRVALVGAAPAVLVLASTAQLNWSIAEAAPYVLGAGIGSVLLLQLTPGSAYTPSSIVVGQAAWTLTCLGAVTAERLYPGSGRMQAVWAMIAVVGFLGAARLGRRWRSTPSSRMGAAIAALGCVGIALPVVPGIGVDVNGAPGWIKVDEMVGQPGEIARPLIVIGIGIMLYSAGPALRSGRIWYSLGACWPLAVAVVIGAYSADLGPVFVLSAAVGAMLLLCRPQPKHMLMFFASAGVAVAGLMLSVSRLRERVDQMLHPVTPSGDLHNTGAALRAFANGGMVGLGFGDGNPHAVANVDNDFVLAGIAEERGILGVIIVVILFAVVTGACWTSALRATSGGPRLAGAGLSSMLAVQSLYVSYATLTIVPVTGMVVPLLSRGGSALLGAWITLGLVVGIGSNVVTSHADVKGSGLTTRMQIASKLTALAWVGVIAVAVAVTTIQPVPASAAPPTSPKGGLVTRDGHPLVVTETDGTRTAQADVSTIAFDPNLVSYVDNATGQRSCTKSWYQSIVAGQCEPRTVVTTLHSSVQQAAAASLSVPGDVVVLDVQTGHVVALYEHPRVGHDAGDATVLSPVTEQTAPGSTFKIITAAAALSQGVNVTTPLRESYTPPGGVGTITNAGMVEGGGELTKSLAESSNTAFAEIATRTGKQALSEMTETLSAWNYWGTSERGVGINVGSNLDVLDTLARTGFGQQDVRATPLALAVVAGKIATNGELPNPTLEAGTCSTADTFDISDLDQIDGTTLNASVTEPIRKGMAQSVSDGRAGALGNLPFLVEAKTGTAEDASGLYDGWVVATAPVGDPKFTVAVRVWADNMNSISRSGAADASPVAAAVLDAAMHIQTTDTGPCTYK